MVRKYDYKKKKENGKNGTGRPSVFTKGTLDKLEHAFSIGSTDLEACIYANINPSSLYNFQNEHPEFLERKTLLKQKPVLQARNVIMGELQKSNVEIAKWYLEKRCKQEFGANMDIDLSVKKEADLSMLTKEQIKNLAEQALISGE